MKLNKKVVSEPVFTHEGAKAKNITPFLELQRSVLASLLWEDTFYENGQDLATRISSLIPKVSADKVSNLAIFARNQGKLRHIPLLLCVEMAKLSTHKFLVSKTLEEVIQRPDELCETLKLYWRNGKTPISNQIKKGLGNAFKKFDEYSLAKYNQANEIKLRDVLFLTHPKPQSKAQEILWEKLVNNELKTPDTWEVALSETNGQNKKEVWERLLEESKLGGLALIRNLRNFKQCGVSDRLIRNSILTMKVDKVLPYRFVTAARYAPNFESELEEVMFKSIDSKQKITGKTVLLIDCSGSMDKVLSYKSESTRLDAACGLAILARELFKDIEIFTFSKKVVQIPSRRGFALRDAILNSQEHLDTFLKAAISEINSKINYDRLIVISDEQSNDGIENPLKSSLNNYMLNIASSKNGVGYGNDWTNISGFSESVIDYIKEIEKLVE